MTFYINNGFAKALVFLAIALSVGCDKGEIRTLERNDNFCTTESKEERAHFILQCIENANPKSDEEPEDWIVKCEDISTRTFCKEITVMITQECSSNLGCIWREIRRRPKPTGQQL